MNNKFNHILLLVKDELRLYFSISISVFLFILFFQPFPLDSFDFNNKLILISGFGAMVFLFTILVRTMFSLFFQKYEQSNNKSPFPGLLAGFVMMALSSVAFAFYLYYVVMVGVTFFIMFKVVLICMVSPMVLWLNDTIKELKLKNKLLIHEKGTLHRKVESIEDEYLHRSIEFVSENRSENLKLKVSDIAFIKTADNYVEVFFKENEVFKKKLLRNTLKNIELQLKPYSIFIRCHRTAIVNFHYVEKLNRNYSNFWLSIKGNTVQVPVSRQYLAKIKETI